MFIKDLRIYVSFLNLCSGVGISLFNLLELNVEWINFLIKGNYYLNMCNDCSIYLVDI